MLRATRVIGAANAGPGRPDDAVVLDWDRRHRRRIAMRSRGGTAFLLDLPSATALRAGDRLVLEDGREIAVEAEPEPLAEIGASEAAALVRIAWHLGNRHLPTQLLPGALRIRRDHVIEEMVRGLGGTVKAVDAPFDPEGGAYGHGAASGHRHAHDHGPDDHHGPGHGHHGPGHAHHRDGPAHGRGRSRPGGSEP